jgi:hypothetical protein
MAEEKQDPGSCPPVAKKSRTTTMIWIFLFKGVELATEVDRFLDESHSFFSRSSLRKQRFDAIKEEFDSSAGAMKRVIAARLTL